MPVTIPPTIPPTCQMLPDARKEKMVRKAIMTRHSVTVAIVFAMSLSARPPRTLLCRPGSNCRARPVTCQRRRADQTQQTGAVIGDFDGDRVNDFILSFRQKPPAVVWYRGTGTGWDVYVIEKDYLTIEAGGAAGGHRWRWGSGSGLWRRLAE